MYTYNAKVYNVVDGDTVDVAVDLGFKITINMRLRLHGIDTPERGQPGYDEAKAFVTKYIGEDIIIRTFKASKFGYYLAEIILLFDNSILNELLVQKALAKPYTGGKKE